ncbi:MAG: hypothetical protein L3K02_01705 [Thermoplasmata archaeon]|nr:hypothetical protein [Thermoplasmata archaeon]
MSVQRIFRPFRLALWAVLGVLVLSTLAVGGATAAPRGAFVPTHSTSVLCPGNSVVSSYTGDLRVVGGPLPASAAVGVSVSYNFSAEVNVSNRTTGALLSSSCELLTGSTSSGANGSFSFELSLPASHCYGNDCTHTAGPFGPVGFAISGAVPPGYEVLSQANGSSLTLTMVAELGGLSVDPSGATRTLSSNAPGTFVATPLTATGSPSPLSPTIEWNLTGSGWSFESSSSGATATVTALPNAGLAELTVVASAAVGTDRFSAGPVSVNLESIPTAFVGGDANRTDLDVGGTVSFTADGSGAPGYNYTAVVAPGLGLAAADWPCSTAASNGDGVTISCAGAIVYPVAGVADPTLELTNSYSTVEGALPTVTVAPLPALSLSPQSPVGYSGAPIPIQLTDALGSGTPPYTLACLDPGTGSPLCSTWPGPNWSFAPVYSAPGTYTGRAWIVDSDGINRSIEFPVLVVAPLAVSAIGLPLLVRADAPSALSAQLTGGDVPVQYWWNVSGVSGSVSEGRLAEDGLLGGTWVPTSPGQVEVSVTVVDALGTADQATELVTVAPANASTVVAVTLPGSGPVTVGAAVPLAWLAEDLQGVVVPGYSAAGTFDIEGSDGAPPVHVYLNASGVGPLVEIVPGEFAIPASAWEVGRLALTVTSTESGTFQFRLSGPGLLDGTGRLAVAFVADLGHLHFYDPTVALAGDRTNATYWRIADEYGNPAPGAAVEISYTSEGTSDELVEPVGNSGSGTTGVWVNFTALTGAGGTREVKDSAGTVLLGPIAVPAATTGTGGLSGPELTLATAIPVGALGLGLTAWAERRRRASRERDADPTDGDLQRLVEGRDRVISLVRDGRALDLAGIEGAWGSAPAPPDLVDWVASLVADGTLGARTGPDGVARFCLIVSADGPPIVLLDSEALDRASATRRELTEESTADESSLDRSP